MCYMVRVGVRELRQNLSVYLRRVAAGETFEVTERGHPVARLMPLEQHMTAYDRLVAEGAITRATLRVDDLPPPVKLRPGEITISEALEEQRSEPA
jgi:prevent-host-death family protein